MARFVTHEATLASVDVSPDGRTLVFDLLGDLYVLPTAGGVARAITHGAAWDAMPRFSPDGRSIVFVSDRSGSSNVWIIDRDGQHPRPVTTGEGKAYLDPVFTPDGAHVVVAMSRRHVLQYDLWSYGVQSGATDVAAHKIVAAAEAARRAGVTCPTNDSWSAPTDGPCPSMSRLHPTVGRDGTLYFATRSESVDAWAVSASAVGADSQHVIVRVPDTLTPVGRHGAMRPVVSPNGRYLTYAYWHDELVNWRLRDLVTSTDTALTPSEPHGGNYGGGSVGATADLMPGAAFAPDGQAFVTFWRGGLWRVAVPSGTMRQIPFTARVAIPLAALAHFDHPIGDGPIIAHQIMGAVPSPDGRRLAFTALNRLYVMDLPHGIPRRVTAALSAPGGEFGPAWAPDGRAIAYTTWDDTAGGAIYRVRVAGDGFGPPEQLTRELGMYYGLAYDVHGQRLFATYRPKRGAEVFGVTNQFVSEPKVGSASDSVRLVSIAADGGSLQLGAFLGVSVRETASPEQQLSAAMCGTGAGVCVQVQSGTVARLDTLTGLERSRLTVVGGWNPAISRDGRALVVSHAMAGLWLIRGIDSQAAHTVDTVALMGAVDSTHMAGHGHLVVSQITQTAVDDPGWSRDGLQVYYTRGRVFYRYSLATGRTTADTVTVMVPRDIPHGTVVFRHARLVTMRGPAHDEVIDQGDIVVRDNRIAVVGLSGRVRVPTAATVIDATGLTILPGYVDLHHHTYNAWWSMFSATPWQFASDLSFGLTAGRNPMANTRLITYADRADAGDLLAPRLYTTGYAVGEDGRGMPEAGSVAAARTLLAYMAANQTETLKAEFLGGQDELPNAPREYLQEYIEAARELHLTPTVHNTEFRVGMMLHLDGFAGQEHPYPVGAVYDDVAQLSARSGLTYTETLCAAIGCRGMFSEGLSTRDLRLTRFMPAGATAVLERSSGSPDTGERLAFDHMAHHGAVISAAGGRVGMGSHGDLAGPGVHAEIWAMAAGGAPVIDVLRSATIVGAEAIGHGHDFGSLDIGKLADLQVLAKNPLEDIHNTIAIKYVMKNGRLYDAMTLDEVYPERRPFGHQWWQGDNVRAPQHDGTQ